MRIVISSKPSSAMYPLTSSKADNLSKYWSKNRPIWTTRGDTPSSWLGLTVMAGSRKVVSSSAKLRFFLYISLALSLMSMYFWSVACTSARALEQGSSA